MSHLLGILQPGSHALAGVLPGTYFCQPTSHNPEATHCCKQAQAVHRNKEKWMHGQALEIPWKFYLMNDKQIAKTLRYFWEVPDPITVPSQEIASSLGRAVMLPLAFCSVAWWIFLFWWNCEFTTQVRWRASPSQFFNWKSQLSCTVGASLSCLRKRGKLMLSWFSCFPDKRWALTQLQREQQIPWYIKWQCKCLSPSHKSWFHIIPYFKVVSMRSTWDSTGIFGTFLFLSTAFPWLFVLSSKLWLVAPFWTLGPGLGNAAQALSF